MVYIGFRTIYDFRHLLGVLKRTPLRLGRMLILWFWPKPEFQSEFKLRIYILHKRLELLLRRWKFCHRYFNSLKFLRLDLDVSESFIFLSNFLLVNDLAIFHLSSLHLSPFCQSDFTNAFKLRGSASLLSRLTANWFQNSVLFHMERISFA